MNHDTAPERKSSGHDDHSEPTTDDRVRTATQLSGFQRDILTILAREGETYGLGIKRELEDWYGDVNHGRLYPNLDELVDGGFIEKYALDDRTNGYRLTGRGQRVLYAYAEHVFQATADTDFRSAAELRTDGAGSQAYDSLADAEMDGVYPCRQCGQRFESEEDRGGHVCEPAVMADGGVEIESLEDAVDAIADGDPDSIAQYDDGHGNFVINSDEDDQDVDEIDDALSAAGFERDGVLAVPGMVQQNFRPADDGGDA